MALNNSGPISLGGSTSGQSVNLELGKSATAQISFNDADVRTLTGTSSGTALIMPTNFYGKSVGTASITNQTIVDVQPDFITSNALYVLSNDGKVYQDTTTTGKSALENWADPLGSAGNFEAYVSVTSGALSGPNSAVNTWLALTSERSWGCRSTAGSGEKTAVISVTIRRTGTATNLTSASITITAQSG